MSDTTETHAAYQAAYLAKEISDLADRIAREVGDGLATSVLYDLSVAVGEGKAVADLWPGGLPPGPAGANGLQDVSSGGQRDGDRRNAPGAAQPPGEYAQVQIMGHNEKIGWVTDGTLAGSACLDIRDDVGRLIAKVPPHSVYLYLPMLPPAAFSPRLAIGPGEEPEGSIEGEYCYCDPGSDRTDPDCPQHGSPF